MIESQYLSILFVAMCLTLVGGMFIGAVWCIFLANDRDSTKRLPRPGTQPFKPDSKLKPFRRHPDMLKKEDD